MGFSIGNLFGGIAGNLMGSGSSSSPYWQVGLPLVGAAVGGPAGAAAGSSIAGGIAANAANNLDWERTKWLLDYNSPIKQVSRLREAGLNPALMYGSGSAGSVSSGSAPSVRPVNYAEGMLDAFLQYALMDKKKDLMDSQIAMNAQNVTTNSARIPLMESQEAKNWSDVSWQAAHQPSSVSYFDARARAENNRADHLKTQNDMDIIRLSHLDEMQKAELRRLNADVVDKISNAALTGKKITAQEIENYVNERMKALSHYGIRKEDNAIIRTMGRIIHTTLAAYDMD